MEISVEWKQLSPKLSKSPPQRQGYSAVYCPTTHTVILYGGTSGSKRFDDVWTYAPNGNTWILQSVSGVLSPGSDNIRKPRSTPPKRSGHAAAWHLNDACMYIFGGDNGQAFLNDMWSYVPAPYGAWSKVSISAASTIPCGRSGHSLTHVGADNGRLVLFGGYSSETGYLSDTWIYDSTSRSWSEVEQRADKCPQPRMDHCTFTVDERSLYVTGGVGPEGCVYSDLWRFDFGTKSWTLIDENDVWKRSKHTVSPFGSTGDAQSKTSVIIVYGGVTSVGTTTSDASVVFLNSDNTVQLCQIVQNRVTGGPGPRARHVAVYVPGIGMILGGGSSPGTILQHEWWLLDGNSCALVEPPSQVTISTSTKKSDPPAKAEARDGASGNGFQSPTVPPIQLPVRNSPVSSSPAAPLYADVVGAGDLKHPLNRSLNTSKSPASMMRSSEQRSPQLRSVQENGGEASNSIMSPMSTAAAPPSPSVQKSIDSMHKMLHTTMRMLGAVDSRLARMEERIAVVEQTQKKLLTEIDNQYDRSANQIDNLGSVLDALKGMVVSSTNADCESADSDDEAGNKRTTDDGWKRAVLMHIHAIDETLATQHQVLRMLFENKK